MMDEQNRNLLLAALLSFALIGLWTIFVDPPIPPTDESTPISESVPATGAAIPPEAATPDIPATPADIIQSETGSEQRVAIDTPSLFGSIALHNGARIDDLSLARYREAVAETSDPVRLLAPVGGPDAYYTLYGWVSHGDMATPGPTTEWRNIGGNTLSPNRPLRLQWDNGAGLIFERHIAVDDRFLFTITQRVQNNTGRDVNLQPYGIIARHGEPDTVGFYILHEGGIGMFDGTLSELDYDDIAELPTDPRERLPAQRVDVTGNGWLGFTDKYWMTALVPAAAQPFTAVFKSFPIAGQEGGYQADMRLPSTMVPANGAVDVTSYLFSGAKEVATIRDYQAALDIDRFEDAVDWGWFFFLTKPIFSLLVWIRGYAGNMGLAIILLTVLVKAVLFPLAYKSYAAMARMKNLQPEMEKLRERVGDDRAKMQQEMMALYRKEKVNPAAGCLPILLQIPIFFSLYKVLFVTIEMRHAPFIGWIRDLAAPDPTTMFNLFGLIPWTPPEFLGIGFWPIMMGVTMWLQMKLSPAPTDPIQQKIFAWLPVIFTFMLGRFPAGLVIYWTANNVLTLIQQYTIMRHHGMQVNLLDNVAASFRRKAKPSGDPPAAAVVEQIPPATKKETPADTSQSKS